MPASVAATPGTSATPLNKGLSVWDAVAILVGVVVGIGIFGFPPLVAMNAPSAAAYMGLWVAGGLVMLVGALCYAELGSAYPDAGGEYAFLGRAWGADVALLFAWARCSIIQTGAIAAVAFIFGDYAQVLIPLGNHGPAIYAALVVVALTVLNVLGSMESRRVQWVLTVGSVLALVAMAIGGLLLGDGSLASAGATSASVSATGASVVSFTELAGMLGMGMVFVLLTYGGWNEAAYLSGEIRDVGRNMLRVLLYGTAIIVALYVLVNLAYLQVFGLEGLRNTHAVGADMSRLLAGPWAAVLLSVLVCCTALGTVNACIFTGGRVYVSLGRDVPALKKLGAWSQQRETPVRALWVQGGITLGLVLFGALAENGLQAMVAYTSPVFWLFMFLTALALIRLRHKDPSHPRPFRVPLYPIMPLVLALMCLGLFWSSVSYAGSGSLLGLLVLLLGLPLCWLRRRQRFLA
ncbi:amino acid permease [Achromobacter sp. F4_2707]|uniref:APC family permease n=1 Tax=Achromobacter sp. F4_2707 TaxID=3114286 RepID=UPI0039C6522A